MCSLNTYVCEGVFNPNIPIFASNSAEGLHFSAFHFCRNAFNKNILKFIPRTTDDYLTVFLNIQFSKYLIGWNKIYIHILNNILNVFVCIVVHSRILYTIAVTL